MPAMVAAPMADDDRATVEAFQAAGYVVQYREVLAAECDGVPDQGPAAGPGCRHLQLLNLARSAPAKARPPDGRPGVTAAPVIEEQLPVAVPLLRARIAGADPRNDIPVVAETFGTLGEGDVVGATDCRHPTRSGHTKIAAAFAAA